MICTCGSGGHPRRCAAHPEAYAQHVAELNDEILYVATLDEALVVAFDGSPPGTIVTVHADDCDADDDGEGCTCEPTEYVTGAQA